MTELSTFHVSIFVRGHLCKTENRILARQTVIVRLLAAVLATRRSAVLAGGKFLETRRLDRVQLLMLATVRNNFVRVGTNKVAL